MSSGGESHYAHLVRVDVPLFGVAAYYAHGLEGVGGGDRGIIAHWQAVFEHDERYAALHEVWRPRIALGL